MDSKLPQYLRMSIFFKTKVEKEKKRTNAKKKLLVFFETRIDFGRARGEEETDGRIYLHGQSLQ